MRSLSVQWFKGVKDEAAKKDFETTLRNSTYVLGKLKELVKAELEATENKECQIADFEDPNWSHKQAFRNGKKSSLKYVLDLLEFVP